MKVSEEMRVLLPGVLWGLFLAVIFWSVIGLSEVIAYLK